MTNIIGQIAMMREEKPCYCSEPKPHWHAYQAVFDGDKWLPMTSQAGIDLIMALQDEGARRQEGAKGFGLGHDRLMEGSTWGSGGG
jgi:hypothetical protein